MMNISKINATGQITIPVEIRNFLHIQKGDKFLFEINKKKSVVLKRLEPIDIDCVKALESTFSSEWNSDGDNEAYNDL
jgi:AbrB family looped-hinge helix DNA binding protein